ERLLRAASKSLFPQQPRRVWVAIGGRCKPAVVVAPTRCNDGHVETRPRGRTGGGCRHGKYRRSQKSDKTVGCRVTKATRTDCGYGGRGCGYQCGETKPKKCQAASGTAGTLDRREHTKVRRQSPAAD